MMMAKAGSVRDCPVLTRIDRTPIPLLEQKRVHILGQELARLGVHDIQAIVIDQHGLLLQPIPPTRLADTLDDPRTNRARKWRALKPFPGLAASATGNGFRHGLIR
jgi:hypothetical protein